MLYVYFDESGNMYEKENDNKFFVIVGVFILSPKDTSKRYKLFIHKKFNKKIFLGSEVKFSNSKIDSKLRSRTLKHIAALGLSFDYGFIKSFSNKRSLEGDGEHYIRTIISILEKANIQETDLSVFIDRKAFCSMSSHVFSESLAGQIKDMKRFKYVRVMLVDSKEHAGIQITDWISGALRWWIEGKFTYKEIIEFFPDIEKK